MLFKLFSYSFFETKQHRTYFYRHRSKLKWPLKKLSLGSELDHPLAPELSLQLSLSSPLEVSDFSEKPMQTLFATWQNIYPQDPKFYSLLNKQLLLWKKNEDLSLEEFFQTPEAKRWYDQRRKLKRKALFELDEPYKRTKASAQRNTELCYKLLRQNPLLRFEDLSELKIRNAQAQMEKFKPYLKHHREAFYERLRQKYGL